MDDNEYIINDTLICESLNFKVKHLSYGQRLYIQLLLVIYSKKPICILDEPFSGLAPYMVEKISNFIKLNNHKIFLITDHNYESLFKIASKKVFLRNGNLSDVSNLDIESIRNMYYL